MSNYEMHFYTRTQLFSENHPNLQLFDLEPSIPTQVTRNEGSLHYHSLFTHVSTNNTNLFSDRYRKNTPLPIVTHQLIYNHCKLYSASLNPLSGTGQ